MPTKGEKSSGGMKRVRRGSGKKRVARTTGKSEESVAEQVEEMSGGNAEEVDQGNQPAPRIGTFFSTTSVKRDDIIVALRQLIMLLDAGTPILASLQTVTQRAGTRGTRALFKDITNHVESGNALWQAFERHPALFDSVFINLIKSSEASGTLVDVLRRQVQYWERREMFARRVRRAMWYPVMLIIVCAAVLVLFSKIVLPEFEALLNQFAEQSGQELHWFTKAYMTNVERVTDPVSLLIFIGVIVVLFILYRLFVMNPLNRLRVDRLKLMIPKLGPAIIRKFAIVEMTRSLALLLRSGLSIMVTLDLVRRSIHNQAVARVLQRVRDSVEQGAGIEQPLRQAPGVVPPVVTDMLVTGEESGQLDQIAEHIAETYEEEVNIALEGLGDLILPVLTIIIGAFVMLTVLAFFIPLIGMIQQISAG